MRLAWSIPSKTYRFQTLGTIGELRSPEGTVHPAPAGVAVWRDPHAAVAAATRPGRARVGQPAHGRWWRAACALGLRAWGRPAARPGRPWWPCRAAERWAGSPAVGTECPVRGPR